MERLCSVTIPNSRMAYKTRPLKTNGEPENLMPWLEVFQTDFFSDSELKKMMTTVSRNIFSELAISKKTTTKMKIK